MGKLKVGINGFGRIGRVFFRVGFEKLDIVGINDLTDAKTLAHLLKYDSTFGVMNAEIKAEEKAIIVNGKRIPVTATKNPAEIPWKEFGAELVVESTGAFKKKEDFLKHLQGGVKRVLISAPADEADTTLVLGVNHETYDPDAHKVVSNASCTTNCLAPLVKSLNNAVGIEQGMMTTIHSYTNDQSLLDAPHKDLRRARSAAVSMIPTTTGVVKAIGKVVPELKGKIDGTSIRVPTPNVSLVDFVGVAKRDVTVQEINEALIAASQGNLKNILAVESHELVSTDFKGHPASSIVDLSSTMVLGTRMFKVLSWYDNEAGFSHRMVDMALFLQSRGL